MSEGTSGLGTFIVGRFLICTAASSVLYKEFAPSYTRDLRVSVYLRVTQNLSHRPTQESNASACLPHARARRC